MALVPNPLGRPPAPELHAFAEDAAATGAHEVFARRGILDRAAMSTVDLFCGPYRLTGLFPPRPGGEVAAGSFAADEDLSHVYVVWADTRGGGSRVYFKRTDTATVAPTAVAAVPVACARGGGLAVSWTPPASPPHCDIDHTRVEYGLAPGIYSWSVDVAGSSTTTLTGLFPSTPYYVRTTTVDEACNEAQDSEVTAVAPDCGATPPCPNPVGNSLLVAATATGDATLTWVLPALDPTHGPATSYDVYRSTGRADAGYTLLANPGAATWADGGAALPTGANQHFYRIVARNLCGTSGDEPP